MEYGVAGTIAVRQISGEFIQQDINRWLMDNPDKEVIDIKMSASSNQGNWNTDALIIYRRDV